MSDKCVKEILLNSVSGGICTSLNWAIGDCPIWQSMIAKSFFPLLDWANVVCPIWQTVFAKSFLEFWEMSISVGKIAEICLFDANSDEINSEIGFASCLNSV